MEVQKGKPYVNRTWKYLFPCMKYYGQEFIDTVGTVFKITIGIGDALHAERLKTPCIYVLVDKTINPVAVAKLINWSRKQSYYVDHYDTNYLESTLMMVYKIPERFHISYEYFINGEYSKMYSKQEIKYLYLISDHDEKLTKTWSDARDVMLQHSSMIPPFISLLKETYGNNIDTQQKDLIGKELDLPTKFFFKEEVFHYGQKKREVILDKS